MFEIVFLGTSASAPSIRRGLSSQAVLAGEYRFLIDCGEGTQRQLLRSGIGFKRMNHILLTHSHLDHILGLGGLVSTFARWENLETLDIYGSRNTLERVHSLLFGVVLGYERLPVEIKLLELDPGTFFTAKDFTVTAFPVVHRNSGSLGYVFQENTRRPFLVEKAAALNIPAGPERGQLVAGQAVTLADGRTIQPDMVLGDPIPGARMVYIGDIGRLDNVREVVAGADTLVIEATFLDADADTAARFGHITAGQAARLALETGVRSLILTHVSRRYREIEIINEACSIFPEAVVARDLDHFVIRRGQPCIKLSREDSRARNPEPHLEVEEPDA
ncbi:MAG: ribonuclease Z [Anaerolineae bacterium]|nr:ribonuclease Z [Anaerolineae bacterium]